MALIIESTDGYKLDHRRQYPEETTLVYSNWTPRKSRVPGIDKVVLFGLQYFIKRYLIKEFNEEFFQGNIDEICDDYQELINSYLGPNSIGTSHIRALHELGHLPISIKALPEGTRSDIRVPQFTVINTHPQFFWLVNYLETLISCEIWQPCTNATLAHEYRRRFEWWAEKTGGDKNFVPFQGHDFSMRGMPGRDAAMASGAAHLLSFRGTDTLPAIRWLQKYYKADLKKGIGHSVAATEHAVMCVGTGFYIKKNNLTWERYGEAEYEVFKRLLTDVYPTGIVSVVSDTWNLWTVLEVYLPQLKDIILARDGKLVIRPDSGDPVEILCGHDRTSNEDYDAAEDRNIHFLSSKGVIEILWDIFGGTINEKGYKELDPHIGAIYGDSINLDRGDAICERLEKKGFSSTNWVAGIGSFTYQFNTRDTFGNAMKATYAEAAICTDPDHTSSYEDHSGVHKYPDPIYKDVTIEIFKDPITDDGMKKSLKGMVHVYHDLNDNNYKVIDQCDEIEESGGELIEVFRDGILLIEYSLEDIRERLWSTRVLAA